jgi:hypothetical protein
MYRSEIGKIVDRSNVLQYSRSDWENPPGQLSNVSVFRSRLEPETPRMRIVCSTASLRFLGPLYHLPVLCPIPYVCPSHHSPPSSHRPPPSPRTISVQQIFRANAWTRRLLGCVMSVHTGQNSVQLLCFALRFHCKNLRVKWQQTLRLMTNYASIWHGLV